MGKSILARRAMNMLSSGIQPQRTDIHPILPLYMVIATAFAGYGLMVAIFIPMLIHDTGFFDKSVPTATRARHRKAAFILDPFWLWRDRPVERLCSILPSLERSGPAPKRSEHGILSAPPKTSSATRPEPNSAQAQPVSKMLFFRGISGVMIRLC